MTRLVLAIGVAGAAFMCACPAHAAFTCNGALTQAQIDGFSTFFVPTYSPGLSKVGPSVSPEHFSKKLTKDQLSTLTVNTPIVAATALLNKDQAKFLKTVLNDNAKSSVPGWFAAAVGAFVPSAWIGLSADLMTELVNGAGDAGRLNLANVAGTVSVGGNVAIVHRVAKDKAGARKFIWAYSYTATLNGKPTTTLLYACAANIVETL